MGEEGKEVFNWPPLESDPEIFTRYFRSIGMDASWKMNEIFGLDADLMAFVPKPAVAVIATLNLREARKNGDGKPGDVNQKVKFYMKQTRKLDNACGVIAGIHSILNNDSVTIEEGSILHRFREKTNGKDPQTRALLLEDDNDFKQAHRSYAQQGQSNQATTQTDVLHHFVAFAVTEQQELIEFDGTKAGPALIAEGVAPENLLEAVGGEIKRRLDENLITEQLALMALCKEPA